ncbi:MAG: signal peptidase II [Desulfosalsimonadaceae bacterium]
MKPLFAKYARLLLIAGLVLLADQASKLWIIRALDPGRVIEIIPGFFNIVHVQNPGGAFGFMAGSGPRWRALFFVIFTIAALLMILYLYRSTPSRHKWLLTAFSLIAGGALGNLIDRLRHGEVVDFIDLYAGSLHWPAFNAADSAITVGMVIFGVSVVCKKTPV